MLTTTLNIYLYNINIYIYICKCAAGMFIGIPLYFHNVLLYVDIISCETDAFFFIFVTSFLHHICFSFPCDMHRTGSYKLCGHYIYVTFILCFMTCKLIHQGVQYVSLCKK
jgi:hypothetical protein